jgi:cytochrome c biogenesis protein
LDEGVPRNVYALDVSEMNEVAGRNADNPGLVLAPGERAEIPGGYGSVSFDGLTRYAAFDIAHNPGGFWILLSSLVALGGLIVSLLIPRRRVWVKAVGDEKIELAALARGDDPRLEDVVSDLGKKLAGGKVGN